MSRDHLFDDAVPPKPRTDLVQTVQPSPPDKPVFDETRFRARGSDLIKRSVVLSDEVVRESQASDGGAFGSKLLELTAVAKGFDPKHLARGNRIIGWFQEQWGVARVRAMASFQSFTQQVDGLVVELQQHAALHRSRRAVFDRLFEENADLCRGLQAVLSEGRAALHDEQAAVAALPPPSDGLEAQLLAHRHDATSRFDKWLHDIDICMTLALETGGQIVMMRDNSATLVDKFDTLIDLTIPAYKKQFMLYLLNQEQAQSAAVGRAVSDATNAAIVKNAELLGMNTAAIARERERSVVDFATVETVYTRFLEAMDENVRIHTEAEQRRDVETAKLSSLRQQFIARVTGPGGLVANSEERSCP